MATGHRRCGAGAFCAHHGTKPSASTDRKCFNCDERSHEDCKLAYDALDDEGYFIPDDELSGMGKARLENGNNLKICLLCVHKCASNVALSDTEIEQKIDKFTLEYVSAVATGDVEWYGDYNIDNVRATKILLMLRGLRFADPPKYRTIRDVYYTNTAYFQNYNACSQFLRRLASRIGLSICHLNIVSDEGRGKIVASQGFKLYYKVGEESETRHFAARSAIGVVSHNIGNEFLMRHYKVPVDGEEIKIKAVGRGGDGLPWKPYRIVLWEKKEWMNDSVRDGVLAEVPLVYICSEGNPSHTTLACVKFLHETYPSVDIVAGGDPGPFGVRIIASYFWTGTMKLQYSVPVKWGFLLPDNVYEDNVTKASVNGSRKSLTEWDKRTHSSLMNHPWMTEERKKCYEAIWEKQEKHEMNNYEPSGGRSLKEFIVQRLQAGPGAGYY